MAMDPRMAYDQMQAYQSQQAQQQQQLGGLQQAYQQQAGPYAQGNAQALMAAAQRRQQQAMEKPGGFTPGQQTPPGWQHGLKRGWRGGLRPPGLARRNPNPAAQVPGQAPAAPGLSSHISPGTVPPKKGTV